jgi:hypothetical protein
MFTLCCKVNLLPIYTAGATSIAMVGNVSCPYCQSQFKDNEELSKHIDRIHHGSGLLEGDSSRW